MIGPGFRFHQFHLDPVDRQLRCGNARVELNARYLDALVLLVREGGKLVSKDRFMEEIWRGVPVTDEALTQCIKTLRRQLGDNAADPRFIETVPKHGYRFVAPVERVGSEPAGAPIIPQNFPSPPTAPYSWRDFLLLGLAGTLGAGASGVLGGLFYGLAGVSQPLAPGMGAISVLLVLTSLTTLIALVGGAGVSFGIAATGFIPSREWRWAIFGGALGGLVVGAFVKLLGLDALNILFGQSPGDITGAPEGTLLGGAVGLGLWLGSRRSGPSLLRHSIAAAGLAGGAAGILITLLGGRLMGGSLDLLVRHVPDSRLRLDQFGWLFGEQGFGPISQVVTGGVEGLLFGSCTAAAMVIARRTLGANA